MSSVLDLGLPASNGYVHGRKQAKTSAIGKDRERSCLRLQRLIISRRVGRFFAFLISAFSLLMLLNVTSRVVSSSAKPVIGDDPSLEINLNDQHQSFNREVSQLSWSRIPPPHKTVEGRESIQKVDVSLSSKFPPPKRLERIQRHTNLSMQRIDSYQHMVWPSTSSDHPLHPDHPCQGFILPPPPADKKRTGPRPCPVCYLPVEQAMDAIPMSNALQSSVIKELLFAEELPMLSQGENFLGMGFGGHPTWEDRWNSYQIQESMKVHCGFANGVKPGAGPGFEIEEADQMRMNRCTGVVVASAIIGNYDQLQQPENISRESMNSVCFFMFIDEETQRHLITSQEKKGVWKLVVVHNLPSSDARRNGKIPKLLPHRLFPNARFSLWIDGKLKLVRDPYQVLERFLLRRKVSFAISRHYKRVDVFEEAEANRAAGKYSTYSINAQVDFYRSEGLAPYNRMESFFPSDVPEGCVIIREHTPVTNLFTCLWFNEVDRFTSRDQLSFAVVRDQFTKRMRTPFRLSMFLDCERRNFVVQGYHRGLLEQRKAAVIAATRPPSIEPSKPHADVGVNFPPLTPSYKGTARVTSNKAHGRRRRGRPTSRQKIGSRPAAKKYSM